MNSPGILRSNHDHLTSSAATLKDTLRDSEIHTLGTELGLIHQFISARTTHRVHYRAAPDDYVESDRGNAA